MNHGSERMRFTIFLRHKSCCKTIYLMLRNDIVEITKSTDTRNKKQAKIK